MKDFLSFLDSPEKPLARTLALRNGRQGVNREGSKCPEPGN